MDLTMGVREAAEGRYEDGKLVAHDIPDIREYWKEDSVAFLSEL